jgi:ABC-2 type transport system permease protein
MRILALAYKDLLQILRDWKAAVFLLVSPIIFTLFFGFLFSGGGDAETDPRLPVGWVDQDGAALSLSLNELLGQSSLIRLETGELADLQSQVADGDLAAVIIVPAGYTASLQAGQPLPIRVVSDPESNAGMSVETVLRTTAGRLQSSAAIAQAGQGIYVSLLPAASPAQQQSFYEAALTGALQSWDSPSVTVSVQAGDGRVEAEEAPENPYAHSSPGMMAQFAIAGLIGAAEVIVKERKTFSLQRMLTTATSRLEILSGHFLAMFVLIFVQFVVLITFGQIFLKLPYTQALGATALVSVSMALCAAGMGLLIGVLAKSEEQVIMLTLVPMFIFSGLGGAWMPLEFMPPAVQVVGKLTPVAWMMEGFQDILLRGAGWQDVLLPAGALLGFAVFFTLVGLFLFRRLSA